MRMESQKKWRLVVIFALIFSLAANWWLVFKVLDYKNRTWQAKLFPDVQFQLSQNPTANAAATPARVDEIWLLGDSRVELWPKASLPESWHAQFLGGGGLTLRETKTGLQDALTKSIPKAILLQCGINDIQGTGYAPETRPKVVLHAERHFREILELAKKHEIKLLVMSILPRGPRTLRDRWFWTDDMDAAVRNLNSTIETICRASEIPFLDCSAVLCGEDQLIKSEFAHDTLHLNEAGYAALSVAATDFVNRFLQR